MSSARGLCLKASREAPLKRAQQATKAPSIHQVNLAANRVPAEGRHGDARSSPQVQNEMLVITSREAARNQPDPRIDKIDGLHVTEDQLIELITSMVAPESWDEVGGTGRIKSLDADNPCFVIAQTDQVHDQIADFLEKLRQAHVAR